ncbi:MAG: hypothetical protein ACOVRJ_16195, partial [Roseateles sp.]
SDSGSASSTSTAGISGIAGATDARTGDKEAGLKPIFDKDKARQEVNAQVAVTSEFGKQASKFLGTEAGKKRDALADQAKAETDPEKRQALLEEAKKWDEGGSYRVALHTVIGGLTGGGAGAVGAGAASAAAPTLEALQAGLKTALKEAGLGDSAANLISGLAGGATAATIGAAASGGSTAGAATAFNADMNNRQLHFTEAQKLAALKEGKTKQEQERLDAAACALVRCADGVPSSDPNKARLVAMQTAGAGYFKEQQQLQASGEFVYDKLDPTRDWITRHGEAAQRLGGAVNAGAGAVGTVGMGVLTMGQAVACPATAISCAGAAFTGTLSVMSYQQAREGTQALVGGYKSTEGQRVLDSFNLETYPGERTILKNVAVESAKAGLTALAAKFIPKGLAAAEDAIAQRAAGRGSAPEVTSVSGKPDSMLPDADFSNKPSGLNETTPIKDKFGKAPNDSDLATHLSTGGPSSKSVYGAHAEAAYQAELRAIGATEIGKPVEIAPGIWEHQYNTSDRIAAGKPPLPKTTYDGTWTDQQILDMSRQASSQVWTEIQRTGLVPQDAVQVIVGGVPFRVLIARDSNGKIVSIYSHPGKK